ncbi:MAG: electron transfer flavoprotein subunit alpha/FixB family protein [Myxococcota bacterium]
MSSVLIVAEHRGGAVNKTTWSALACGKQIADAGGHDLEAVVLGKDIGSLAQEIAKRGVKTVHVAEHDGLEYPIAEAYAKVVADVAKATGAVWVGTAGTVQGRDFMPRVAAILDAGMATDIVAVDGETLSRPMWAASVLAEVTIDTPVKLFTAQPTEFDPIPEGGAGEIVAFKVDLDASSMKAEFSGFEEIKSERPPLTDADVVIAGGRGTKGNFEPIEKLADMLGAAIGATRAAIDAGWQPNDLQVGQTGKVIAPTLYIGAGVSGAIQHLAGMKGSKTIVAINKDPEAPIFQVADYGLEADLFKAIPEFIEEYKKVKA